MCVGREGGRDVKDLLQVLLGLVEVACLPIHVACMSVHGAVVARGQGAGDSARGHGHQSPMYRDAHGSSQVHRTSNH